MKKLELKYDLDEFEFENFNVAEYQSKTVEQLNALIENGDLCAYYGLAFKYNTGDTVLCDKTKGRKILKDGYKQGSMTCGVEWILLEYFYLQNANIEKGLVEAQKLLNKRCGEALVIYATTLYFGIGTEINVEEAKRIFEYCVEKDCQVAIKRYLGALAKNNLLRGKFVKDYKYDVEQENVKTFELAQRFGNRTDVDFIIRFYLYSCYLYSYGVEKDVNKAFDVMQKIVGKVPNNSFVNYLLLQCYIEKSDYSTECFNTINKALAYSSSENIKEQMYDSLGFMYLYGYGVEADPVFANLYVREAIKLGGEKSHSNVLLGKMYEKGIAVNKDVEKAKTLYENSLKYNWANAYLWLADLCFEEKNYQRAEELYSFVVGKGFHEKNEKKAQNKLEEIKKLKCHNCKYVFVPVEVKKLFGKKKICPHCGAKWKNLFDYEVGKKNKK